MKSPFRRLLGCLTLMVALAVCVAPSQAATFTVTNTADSGAGSLRAAILGLNASVDATNTISFSGGGASGAIPLTSELPSITRSVTLTGPGAKALTVRRQSGIFRIFQVNGGTTVTISGLTIASGQAPSGQNGGGLLNLGSTTVNDCAFVGNMAPSGDGGGFYNDESNLTINRCLFQDNSAVSGGGGESYNNAGQSTTTVRASTFSGNTATTGYGGGYRNLNGPCVLDSCTLVGNTAINTAGSRGAGLASSGSGRATTTVKNCILVGNTGAGNAVDDVSNGTPNPVISQGFNIVGGGLNGTAGVFNQPSDQVAVTVDAARLSPLRDNGGPTLSIIARSGSPAIDRGSTTENDQRGIRRPIDIASVANASGGNGADVGAIETQDPEQNAAALVVSSTADSDDGVCGISDCTLREAINAANASGSGAIGFASSVVGTIQLSNSLPNLNSNVTITGPGAQVLAVRRSATAAFSIFNVLSGKTVTISGLTISNGSSDSGGGIYNVGTLTVTGCVLSGNAASNGGGGGIYNGGTLTVTGSTFTGNTSTGTTSLLGGGGLCSYTSADFTTTSTTIRLCTFSGNTSRNRGGGVCNFQGLTVIESSTLTLNGGGGLSLYTELNQDNSIDSRLQIKNTIVVGNSDRDVSFDMSIANNVVSQGTNLIGSSNQDSLFNQPSDQVNITKAQVNLAPLALNGGATPSHALYAGSVALDAGSATGTDQRGVARPIDLASVPNGGGGNGADVGSVEVQDPALSPSSLVVNTVADNDDGACTITNCTLREAINAANPSGGAIRFAASVTGAIQLGNALPTLASGVSIAGPGAQVLAVRRNSATNFRIFSVSGRPVSISGLTITNGSVGTGQGAGVHNFGTLTLTDCVLSNNTGTSGGGLYNAGILTAVGCTFSGNSASLGGGLYADTEISTAFGSTTLRGCTISVNSANSGGGLYHARGQMTLENSTIAFNTARDGMGGGLLMRSDSGTRVRLRNTILAANVGPDVSQVNPASSNLLSDGFNVLGTGASFSNGIQGGDQVNVTATQLNLAPLALNGGTTPSHAPLPGSVAIDAGSATGTDQRGVARPFDIPGIANAGNGADVGALELRVPILDLDASSAGLDAAAAFAEGGGAVSIGSGSATATAGERAAITSATITLANRPNGAAETLAITLGSSGLAASAYDPATGSLTVSGSASPTTYAQVLATVTYNNTAPNPDPAPRTVTVTISDGVYSSPPASSSITNASVNDAPSNVVPGAQTTPEDTPLVFSSAGGNAISVSDPDGTQFNITLSVTNGTVTVSGSGLLFAPGSAAGLAASSVSFSGSQADVNAALDGLAFTPRPNFSGGATLTIRTGDAGNTGSGGEKFDEDTGAITITPVNDAPVAVADVARTDEDTSVLVDVRANDTDVDSATLTVVSVTPGAAGSTHGTLAIEGNQVRYTPEPNYSGPSTWSYTISDGALTASAPVTVTVRPVNDAPVAVADSVATDEDTSVLVPVLANDSDIDGPALSIIGLLPGAGTNGTLAVEGSQVRYTPSPNFVGASTWSYTVSDGTLTASALVTVTVRPVNDAPVAQAQSVSTTEDTPVSITLGATDVDSAALGFAIATPPARGTLSGSGASLVYTPAPNFNGVDSFTFRASDGALDSNLATVTVQVLAANDAPLAVADAFAAQGTSPLTVAAPGVLGNDTDADGQPLSASIATPPAHGTLALGADGAFTYTPEVGFNGADSFTYRASDGTVLSEAATVTLDVGGNPSRSLSLSLSAVTVREGGAVTGTLTLSRPAPAPLSVQLSSSDASAATVPASVQVLAGQTRATFALRAPRNTLATGPLTALISAQAGAFGTASARLTVTDIEAAALTLAVAPSALNDNFGPAGALGTVSRNTPTALPLSVRLSSSNATALRAPAAVVIPAGARSATFLVTVLDNRIANAPRRVNLTASAAALKPAVAALALADNGRVERDLRLFLENSGRYAERVGGQVAQGSVTLPGAPLARPLAITLVASDPSRLLLPRSVVLPAGKSVVSFTFRVLDNAVAEGDFSRVWVTARATGYGTSALLTLIQDNDGPSLSLSLPGASTSEGAGTVTATLTRRNTSVNAQTPALVVALASSNRSRVTVPARVTIPKGRASVTFPVAIVNNRVADGTTRVTLTASQGGFLPGTATLDVLDDEAPRRSTEAAQSPALSSASASVGQGIRLRFWAALDQDAAQDALAYQVVLNGQVAKLEGATYDAATRTVVLTLPEGTLSAGDQVEVSWQRLQDAQGQALSGATEEITVR